MASQILTEQSSRQRDAGSDTDRNGLRFVFFLILTISFFLLAAAALVEKTEWIPAQTTAFEHYSWTSTDLPGADSQSAMRFNPTQLLQQLLKNNLQSKPCFNKIPAIPLLLGLSALHEEESAEAYALDAGSKSFQIQAVMKTALPVRAGPAV